MIIIKKKLIPAYVWGATILTVSSIPYLEAMGPKGWGLDKLAHFGIYLILGLLVREGNQSPKKWEKELSIILVFAIIDELHQVFVPGRFVEWTDIVANFAGAICAYLPRISTELPACVKTCMCRLGGRNGNIQNEKK